MRTPQERKALSYARDRRNTYGGNDKASRKGIPRGKRMVNRVNRHADRRLLDAATGRPDEQVADAAEQRALGRRRPRWTKHPDEPLGTYLAFRAAQRARDAWWGETPPGSPGR